MGRKRKNPADNQLPPDVYTGRSAYEWRPKNDNGQRRTVTLCPLTAPIDQVWEKYLEAKNSDPTDTLRWLLREYMQSPAYASRAPTTRRGQAIHAHTVINHPIGPGNVFGDVKLRAITPGIIRQYLDVRAESGAAISGNREKSLISRAWNWAIERDKTSAPNPCKEVARNTEHRRQRYVTDHEYQIVHDLALSYPPDTIYYRIAIAMELAYLCRFRKVELLTARRDQITDDGLDTRRAKRGRDTITEWSPRLRTAVDNALQTHGDIPSIYLLSNGKGGPIAEEGFNTAWTRIILRAVAEHGIDRYTFHDLRRKGTTDFQGTAAEKTDAGGWNNPAMLRVYDLSKPKTKPTR